MTTPAENARPSTPGADADKRTTDKLHIRFRQSLMVAIAAGIGYGFDAYAVNIYSIVLPSIRESLEMSLSAAGLIGSIFLVGYTIGTIGFGIAADRFGRRDTLGLSIVMYGLTTSLGGLTTNVPLFTALRFLTGVGGAGGVGYWGMTVFLTTFMVQKFGVSPARAVLYAILFYVGQFFFSYLGTGLSDLRGRKFSAILGAVIMMASTAFGALSNSLSTYLVFGGISIAMLGWLWGVGDTYISELFPTRVRGTGFGISVGGGRIMSIFAPFLVGWGIDTYGPTTPYLAFTGLWLLTIIGYMLGPETARKELEETAVDVTHDDLKPNLAKES